MKATMTPSGPGSVERVALSRDGRYLFGSTTGESVFLLERDGSERWCFPAVPAEALVVCEGTPTLFLAGTWNGTLRVHVPDGFSWERPLSGVVASVAASEAAGKVVAGSWDGTAALFGLDGTPLVRLRLPEAVLGVVLPPEGGPAVATLADGGVVAFDSAGEVWRHDAGEPILAVAASGHETLVASAKGGLVWLDGDGRVSRRVPPLGRLLRAAFSSGGSWFAGVESPSSLRLVRVEDGSGWGAPLPAAPIAVALAGDAESPVCLVSLPGGRLLALNRWQVAVEEAIEGPVEPSALSRWGTEAATIACGGRAVVLQDLPAIRRWLPPPRVALRLVAGKLVEGQVGTLAIAATNEGGRAALGIEVSVSSDFLRTGRKEALGDLSPGEKRLAKIPVEPERAGDLLLVLTVAFRDEVGEARAERFEEVVPVRARAD